MENVNIVQQETQVKALYVGGMKQFILINLISYYLFEPDLQAQIFSRAVC